MREDTEPRKLITQAKEGDAQAFGRLYELYFTPVYRYLMIRVKDRALAEDLTQTVFMKVYRSIDSFTLQRVSPLAYFFTVARHTVIDHWKRKGETTFGDLATSGSDNFSAREEAFDVPDDSMRDTDRMDRTVLGDRIQQMLETLSADQRDALSMKFIGQLSNKEIAKALGKSETAIRQLQSRGLRILREKYHTQLRLLS
jgi:RNA polymerase sigma-70 factor (ECF subfamily)